MQKISDKNTAQCVEHLNWSGLLQDSKGREELIKNMEQAAVEVNRCYANNGGRYWDLRYDLQWELRDRARGVVKSPAGSYPKEDRPTALRTGAMIDQKAKALAGQYVPWWKATASFWKIVEEDVPALAWGSLVAVGGALAFVGKEMVQVVRTFIPNGPPMILLLPGEGLDPFGAVPPA